MKMLTPRHRYVLVSMTVLMVAAFLPLSILARSPDSASNVAMVRGSKTQGTTGTSKVFQESGKTVRGKFLEYWERNGNLARFGYPISEEMQEKSGTDGKTYTVQYFERAVFELHPENKPPYEVLLQLLGVLRYRDLYSSLGGAPNQKTITTPGAEKFPQTGKTVGGKFLEYWRKNGGLAQYGYPISDEFGEQSPLDGKTYTVQYFERAVFELHPENKPPYEVLLSQLGTFRWQDKQKAKSPTPSPIIPTAPVATTVPTSTPTPLLIPTPEFRSDIPDGQYLPLYPGAIIKNIIDRSYTDRVVQYEVAVEVDRLIAFYDDVMPKYGWTLIYSRLYSKVYSWTDPKGIVPWHISLRVEVRGNVGSGRSLIDFFYRRYPDENPKTMVLYPDAHDVVVSVVQSGSPYPTLCSSHTATNTTYLTAATSAEVESFYRSALPPHGWELWSDSRSIESPGGVWFRSDRNIGYRPGRPTGTWTFKRLDLFIMAQPGPRGLTKITIELKTCVFDAS